MSKEQFAVDPTAPNADQADLIGEGKKYANTEVAAKALLDKDTYIRKLEGENAVYKESSGKLDTILESLATKGTPVSQDPPATPADGEGKIDIEALVNAALDTRTTVQKGKDNANTALTKLAEHYGDLNKAKLAVKKLTTDDASEELYYKLAGTDPDSFVAVVKARVPQESNASDPLAGLGDAPAGGNSSVVPWSEAKKVLLSDKKKYYSKEYQDLINTSEAYYTSKDISYFKNT